MLEWSLPADARIRVSMLNTEVLHQHAILWQLLQHTSLYLLIQPRWTTLEVVLWRLDEARQAQHLNHIRHLDYVILADCDLLPPDVLSALLKYLMSLSDRLHIILVTRATRPALLDDAVVAQMRFFPEGKLIVGRQSEGQWIIEVDVFRSGQVISQGRLIEDWHGDLTRGLFFFLINKPIVRRDEISQAFWRHRFPQEAINLFHVTRLRLKNVLGVDLMDFEQEHYRLSSSIHLIYDVNDFLSLIERSQQVISDDDTIVLLESAIGLYRTSYMETLDFESAAAIQRRCEDDYCDALVRLACLYFHRGEVDRSAGLLARAARVQMGREDIVYRLMQIYMSQGKPADALQAYQRLEAFLKASTGIFRPSDDLRKLAAETGTSTLLPVYCR